MAVDSSLPLSITALLAIPVAGLPLAHRLGLRGPLLGATGWLLGAAMLALLMLATSALQIRWSRGVLGVCWLLAAGVPLLVARMIQGGAGERRFTPMRPITVPDIAAFVLAVGVCGFQLLFSLLQAVRVPLGSFDSWSLWEYKGRRFWLDAGLNGDFLRDHAVVFAHPAYPPLLPLLTAWVYTWIGHPDPALIKPIYPLFFLALLLAFFAALHARIGTRAALLGTPLLALLPSLVAYAGSGLADVPLAAALVAAASAFVARREGPLPQPYIAAGLLLGVALLTKRDAAFFAIAALPTLWLLRGARWRTLLWVLLPAGLLAAPWYLYAWANRLPDRDFLPATPHNLLTHAGRLGEIGRLFGLNLLVLDEWGVLWFVLGALLVAGLVGRRLRAPGLLCLTVVPLLLYVLSLSLSAWPDYTLHVRTSLDRLIMVTAPFALWFVLEQIPAITVRQHLAGT